MLDISKPSQLTYKVELPGGQRRLREAILYVCAKCKEAEFFGLVKLNKILWWADFTSFAERGQPITGRMYQRAQFGPVPIEMKPLLDEMQRKGEVEVSSTHVVNFEERRPIALVEPMLRDFSPSDIEYIDRAISVFWTATAKDASDRSHGFAWRTRENGDLMAYDLAYLSDQPPGRATLSKLEKIGRLRRWRSQ